MILYSLPPQYSFSPNPLENHQPHVIMVSCLWWRLRLEMWRCICLQHSQKPPLGTTLSTSRRQAMAHIGIPIHLLDPCCYPLKPLLQLLVGRIISSPVVSLEAKSFGRELIISLSQQLSWSCPYISLFTRGLLKIGKNPWSLNLINLIWPTVCMRHLKGQTLFRLTDIQNIFKQNYLMLSNR